MEKREMVLVGAGAAFIAIIILLWINISKLNDIEERLTLYDNVQYEMENIRNNLHNISADVQAKMDDFVEQQIWVQDKAYELSDVDSKEMTVDVHLRWNLRDLEEGEKLSFLYRGEGDEEWEQIDIPENDALGYTLDYEFPMNQNFETKIVAKSEVGIRSEAFLTLPFKDQFHDRIIIDAFFLPATESDYNLDINIFNEKNLQYMQEFYNDNRLKMTSAKATILIDGESIQEIDLMKEADDFHSDQYVEGITYTDLISLEQKKWDTLQVHIQVEDGLGIKYERIIESQEDIVKPE
ncbi:hypothetical protein [Salirhabdus sp. Marseille-P4669]|uniref:hypothetical protein n=1 Tax=Salirhabdus sp. Marseille-P4669 TaxID=2042310 RepID=UPI000C7DBC95|nr:hypothetical protein [Salirhabdus sp. Marseille-P4669]